MRGRLAIHPAWLAATAVGVLVLDQVTKYAVTSHLPVDAHRDVLPPVLFLVHVVNQGMAWGMFAGRMNLLALVSLAVLVLLVVYFRKFAESWWEREWGLAALVGGIGGNLIDRLNLIARPSGRIGVVDFVSFQYAPWRWEYPAFNVADMAICAGVAVYCLSCWFRPAPTAPAATPSTWRTRLRDWLTP